MIIQYDSTIVKAILPTFSFFQKLSLLKYHIFYSIDIPGDKCDYLILEDVPTRLS